MDWNLAIERNTEALKRILAALVAMAELGGQFTFFPQKSALPHGSALAEKSKLSPASTLPRHLHTAVLRLLRPAEAAVRRLIIVAARSVVVPPPPPRSAWSPSPASQGRISGTAGTTWILPRSRGRGTAAGGGGGIAEPHATTRPLTLPLFDRLPRWESRPRRPIPNSVPRISVPGYTTLSRIVPRRLPSPDDPVDATRLGRRFATLAAALDDLPRQAKRFARWRARRDAINAQDRNPDAAAPTGETRRSRPHRIWPLHPGRPPGQHPRQGRKKSRHEVHEILKDLHGLAFDVLEERRDTS
ncbi:hypothetical protein [Mesorhizobium sp. ZC-5]|uniref:hypothetical protein n=1 Tax=Mesorhizobium sp. ZC-5 TaxID=2986066 RepID=UPI0021E83FB2|nr:hypothetical protein [Mesorhizobium sp. ZC-5]MCV3240265.1 hypothetical protein [Mesorhizobium sp. ZC-5]